MRLYRRSLTTLALAAGLSVAVLAAPALGWGGGHGSHYGQHHGWRHQAAPISAAEFLTQAAAGNQFEIVTGRLAQERAGSGAIRTLGAEFVADHTAMLQQGAAVAAQLGIPVTPVLTPEQSRAVALLERLSGRSFDRAWLRIQLRAHKEALALHLRGALRGDRPEIRALAAGGLPVVVHHLGELLDLACGGRAASHSAGRM